MRRLTVLLLVLPVLLAGCAAAAPQEPARDAQDVRAELQRTYEQTWGDPRTRHAVEVLAYVEHEERLASCLAARGAGHVPAPFTDAAAREPGPLSWYDPLLPVDARSDLLVPADGPAPTLVPTRTWPGRKASAAEVGACLEGPPQVAAVDPVLDDRLYDLVTEALGADAQVEGYRECLRDSGFDAGDRDELVDVLLGERTPDGRPGPRERAAVEADAACRSEAHEAAMAALDEPLRTFRETHADELARTREEAAGLRSRAVDAAARMGLAVTWW